MLIGGLIVLALTAALVAPYFVDWTSYRADFEREASAILGRKVTVEGEARARLLPFPSVTFSDVSVAGGPDGKPAMTVETFSMDAELAPLMSGEVHIFDMRLVRPKATLAVGADGRIDWAMRPSAPFDARHISLERLTITEGQIAILHGKGGREHLLSEINTVVSARSLSGPWRMDGSLRIDGARAAVQVSTGKVDDSGALRVRIKADPVVYPLVVEADGDIRLKDGAALYAGTFKVDARSVSKDDLRGLDGQTFKLNQKDDKSPPPYRLNGTFAFDHEQLLLDAFRFETGPTEDPYTADGIARLELGEQPSFAIEATGAQVRFDDTIASGEASSSGLTLTDRIRALEAVLADLPKPTIPGKVEVNLPAVVAGDTTIRDVRMHAEPVAEGWELKNLAATLPGRTTLEASGLLRTNAEIGFAGSLLLAVNQPSGFAAWLARDVDEAIRRLPGAGFKATVDMSRGRQRFSGLELILGKAKFRGAIDARQPADAKPSMLLELEGDALDVEGLGAFASLFVSDTGATRLSDHDLDLTVKAGPVSAGGMTADTVDAALRLRGGQLEIDRLSVIGLEGATISATGSLRDFATRPVGNIDASIVSVDLAPLATALAERYPENTFARELDRRVAAYPGLLDAARIDMMATGVANPDGTSGIALTANGNAGGAVFSLTASGTADSGISKTSPLSLSFSATSENAEVLTALYGLPTLPLGAIGPGETMLTARGTVDGGLDTAFSLTASDFKAEYKGAVAPTPDGLSSKGKVALNAADFEPWLMTAGVSLPGMGLGLPMEFSADASYAAGKIELSEMSGTLDEGAFGGDIAVGFGGALPHLTGALTLDTFDLAQAAAMVLGEAALADNPDVTAETPFRPRVEAPFTADIVLVAGTVDAGMLGTAHEARMNARLDKEGLRIANLIARTRDGDLTGLFELKNTDGTALFSGQMKVADADLGLLLDGAGLAGRGDVSANLSASGKSASAMVSSLSGSGTASVKNLVVAGVNPYALQPILARSDTGGREVDAAQAALFVDEIAGAGSFAVPQADFAFSVAGGVLRAPPLSLQSAAASIDVDLRGDLNTEIISATGEIAYRAGDEALVGSEPAIRFTVTGPLGGTERRFDAEPMVQFLTQRALEREQARVEAMQAVLLEKQRLRREVRYYASLQAERDRAAELLRKAEEERRFKAEAEARAAAEAKARAEEEEARRTAEVAAARAAAEAAALLKAEEEKRVEAEEAARLAEKERARKEAEQAAEQAKAPKPATRPTIERAPLPPAGQGSDSGGSGSTGAFNPVSIDNFLKSLRGD